MELTSLSWVEIKKDALVHNVKQFRQIIGDNVILAPAVKANAYGHGLIPASKIMLEAGADWLCVDSIFEAKALREANVMAPIYVFGYVMLDHLELVVDLDCKVLVYNYETVDRLAAIAEEKQKIVDVHLKVETGTNRQGLPIDELLPFAQYIQEKPFLHIEGLSTHFANIEDVKNHEYTNHQIEKFDEAYEQLQDAGVDIVIRHCANAAATMLFPKTHYDMVRPGISIYGIWPSEIVREFAQEKKMNITLEPVFSWKTRIAQVKKISKGSSVGYGCTFTAEEDMQIAIVPVGYYDGYDRNVSGKGYVLVHDKKASVIGRVCMNMIVIDVTGIENVKPEDEVVLLGQGKENSVPIPKFAEWVDRITYELPTRVMGYAIEEIPRIVV